MPLDKKVKLASFQENMLSHKTVFLSLCRSLWEDKLLHTLVPAARLFSRAACLAISHGTGVSKSCSRRVSFWDWGEYDDFSKVVGLVSAFGARVEIIFAHIFVFPACAIELQHINENSPTILRSLRKDGYTQVEIDHLFKAIVLPKITYALPVYGASQVDLNTIQCFLKRCNKRRYTSELINIYDLLEKCDRRLFTKIKNNVNHPLYALLRKVKESSKRLRFQANQLPRINTEHFKNCYFNRIRFQYNLAI